MSKELGVENCRSDKIVAFDKSVPVATGYRELFYARLDDDGSMFFEFRKGVNLELNGSNSFTVRIKQ